MSNHTKGPWIAMPIVQVDGWDGFEIKAQPCKGVMRGFTMQVAYVIGPNNDDEPIANAALIAASPDLLRELSNLVSIARMGLNAANMEGADFDIEKELAPSISALKKAEGKS